MPFHCRAALALTILPGVAGASPQDTSSPNTSGGSLLAEEAAYDVLHYALELEVDPAERAIDGVLAMRARLVAESPEIVVDLDEALVIDAVTLNGEPSTHRRADEQRVYVPSAQLQVGDEFVLAIEYGGRPHVSKRPPWQGGFTWAETDDGSPWIATSCQGEGADLWWPCKDHPSDEADSMDIRLTVPKPLLAVSNGRQVDRRDAQREGWQTFHWHVSTPINNYGVALGIGPYVQLDADYTGVDGQTFPFAFWVLPEHEEEGRAILDEFADHVRFHEELLGPYPFRADKYGVIETPHLGMEHQTLIAYGNRFRGDPNFDYDWLHHHELSHEWWANLVTARDWSDFWIHEGLGTYMQALYLERRFGPEAYAKKMALDRRGIANQGAVAPRGERDSHWMYFSHADAASPGNDIYFKGSWICHALRGLVGDEAFFQILRRWAYPNAELESALDGSACRLTSTDELLAIAEDVSELELDWFFEVYLRQPALPKLIEELNDGTLTLRWEAPGDLEFPMPVEVRVGERVERVEFENGRAVLDVGANEVEIDPQRWLLREK